MVAQTRGSPGSTSSSSSMSVGTRYTDRRELAPTGSGLPIEFGLPADAPETALAAHPPRYWEIAIEPPTDTDADEADANDTDPDQASRHRRPRRRACFDEH